MVRQRGALGLPVVPLVYWMLMASSGVSSAPRRSTASTSAAVSAIASHAARAEDDHLLQPRDSGRASSTIAT